MGYGVLGGTVLQCSFGMAPSVLNVLPTARVISSMPMASIAAYCRNMDAWFSYCIGRRKASFESKLQTDLCLWRHH